MGTGSEYFYTRLHSEGNYFSICLTIRNNTTDADLGVHAKNWNTDTDCTQIRPECLFMYGYNFKPANLA